jgi:TonB family protein
MSVYLWNIAAYAIQLAALAAVAFATTRMFRLRLPMVSLRFWQAVMFIAVALPFLQPRRGDDLFRAIAESDAVATVTQTGAALAPAGVDIAAIVVAIIAAGIVLRLAWLAIGLLRLRSIVASATPDASLDSTGVDLTHSLAVTAALKISDEVQGPATIGVRRPVILIPRSVVLMPAAVQRAILCHELLHVKRRDWLHTIAEELWCAVLWFHPAARALASRLSLARETVVDEMTILHTRDRRAYAEALLAFSDPQPHLVGATPFIGRRTLSQRISLIAEEAPMSRRRALIGSCIALITAVGVSILVVNRFPMSATPDEPMVYAPGNGVSLPRVVKEVKPVYTAAAMQKKIQGSIWTSAVVGPTGDVTDVSVTRSLDSQFGLDVEAVKAVRQWKFTPAVKDGQPVAARVTIELTFTLR